MSSAFTAFRLRTPAFLLDYIFIVVYIGVLISIGISLGFDPLRAVFPKLFADANSSEITAFLLLVLPVVLYFALFECSPWQATWGKRKMGLLVTNTYGKRLSLARSLLRSLLKLLPWEITHACLWRIPGWPLAPRAASSIIVVGLVFVWVIVGVYVLSLFLSKTHQTLYDLLAGARVVKISSDRLSGEPGGTELNRNITVLCCIACNCMTFLADDVGETLHHESMSTSCTSVKLA